MDSSHFSTLINDFKPGIFGALNEKKEELLREGRKVYNLSVGTPDFRPGASCDEGDAGRLRESGEL